MFKTFKTTMLAATLGLTSLVGISAAQAGDIRVVIGGHDGPHHAAYRGRPVACTPARAVTKAERMGIVRARVTNVNYNRIKVTGYKKGRRMAMIFGRAPSCPVLSTQTFR